VLILNKPNVFGTEYYYAESLGDSSTTSLTVWSTKVTVTPSEALTLGNYLVIYSCVHTTSNANRETDVRIVQDATTLFEVRTSILRTQGKFPVSGVLRVTGVSGTPSFKIDFKVGGTATTSTVSEARLAIWRIND